MLVLPGTARGREVEEVVEGEVEEVEEEEVEVVVVVWVLVVALQLLLQW